MLFHRPVHEALIGFADLKPFLSLQLIVNGTQGPVVMRSGRLAAVVRTEVNPAKVFRQKQDFFKLDMSEGRFLVQSGDDLRRENGPSEMDIGFGAI